MTMTTASAHVTAWHVCGLAEQWHCTVWVLEWCQVTVNDLTGMQQQSVCGPTAHAPKPTRRPSSLLMVHAMLTMPCV